MGDGLFDDTGEFFEHNLQMAEKILEKVSYYDIKDGAIVMIIDQNGNRYYLKFFRLNVLEIDDKDGNVIRYFNAFPNILKKQIAYEFDKKGIKIMDFDIIWP